jgi:hypothetical protein
MSAWMMVFQSPHCCSPQIKYSHHLPRISGMEREGDTYHQRSCRKQRRDSMVCGCYVPAPFSGPELLFSGCRKTLVKTGSETGWRTHATGLYPGTAIGVPPSRCGFLVTMKKYSFPST